MRVCTLCTHRASPKTIRHQRFSEGERPPSPITPSPQAKLQRHTPPWLLQHIYVPGPGVGVGAGVLVAADRLPDAVESGVDRIPRRGVDRALQRVEDATKNAIGVDLVLLRRERTAGVLGIGATAVAVKVGIQSGAEGAPEVGPVPALVLALLLGDVVAPEADLNLQ